MTLSDEGAARVILIKIAGQGGVQRSPLENFEFDDIQIYMNGPGMVLRLANLIVHSAKKQMCLLGKDKYKTVTAIAGKFGGCGIADIAELVDRHSDLANGFFGHIAAPVYDAVGRDITDARQMSHIVQHRPL